MPERDQVFFSYRHDEQGQQWLELILRWLEPYALGGRVTAWSDRDIRTGDQWESRICGAIGRARVAVLLVNHTFFGSSYICAQELPPLLAAARAGQLTLVPVPIGPCDRRLLAAHGLDDFQFTHPPEAPLSGRIDNDRLVALTHVAMSIYDALGAPALARSASVAPAGTAGPGRVVAAAGSQTTTTQGVLHDVPSLDARHFVERHEDLRALRDRLLHGLEPVQGITSAAAGVGLHGMGGMGKSVLAAALCHDVAVRRAFPDGIAWVVLGQQPDLLALQNRLLRHFQPDARPAENVNDSREALANALRGRRVLVVLDDIWDARHFGAFDATGPHGRLFVTTRDAAILTHVGARPHELQRLPDALARRLLASWAGIDAATLPPEVDGVIEETGGLPLALALAGAQAGEGTSWATLAGQLRQGRLQFLDHAYGSVYASLGRSVEALTREQRDRYLELAVFPEDAAVPAQAVQRLWSLAGVDQASTERLLSQLAKKALLGLQGGPAGTRVVLHDLQQDFVRARCLDREALHARLLDGYRGALALPPGPTGWGRLPPDEPYLWPHLAGHLVAAGRAAELEQAQLSIDFLAARLRSVTRGDPPQVDVAALLADFSDSGLSSAAHQVGRALRRSGHVLAQRPQELGRQLFGRLGSSADETLRELAAASLRSTGPRGLTPTLPTLSPPGALQSVLTGHLEGVLGALVLPDGRRALSWSGDLILRLWDLDQPGAHQVLAGHQSSIEGVLLLPDERRLLSWSADRTLRLWDLDRPGSHQILAGHQEAVSGALALAGGRRALSWSRDGTLRLWDLERPQAHDCLEGHRGQVSGALLLPGGQHALSWANDNKLRLWDLHDPGAHRVLEGHERGIAGARLLPDGRHVLTYSGDVTLRLWDLEQPGSHKVYAGHKYSVTGALPLPDGRRALSWSSDCTLRLWNLDEPGTHAVLEGHENAIEGAMLLADGRRALSWSRDHSLRLWDLDDPGVCEVFSGHESAVEGALLLPDGHRALSWSNERTLRLWNLDGRSADQVLSGHEEQVRGVALLGDGRRALSWSDDRTLRLWDLQQSDTRESRSGHTRSVWGTKVLSCGRRALSWSSDHTLRLWELDRPGAHRVLAGHEHPVWGALLLPGERQVLSWSSDLSLRLWDLDDPDAHRIFTGHHSSVWGVLLLPDGRHALSWSSDSTLRLWDLEQPQSVVVFPAQWAPVTGAQLLSDGRRALSWSNGCQLRLLDLGQPDASTWLAGHNDTVGGVLVTRDDRRALSWSADHTLRLWQLGKDFEHQILEGHAAAVSGALLLPAQGHALSWSEDRSLRLWDLDRPGAHEVFTGHEDSIIGTLLSSDGRRALSWSRDHTLRLWDLQRPSSHRVLAGHDSWVTGALLLPDGRHALSWSDDGTVRLWDLATTRELDAYVADTSITAGSLSPDGSRACVGDGQGNVQILHVRPSGLSHAAG